ncbi:sigma-70 family RNA polymerase sigma factor [Nesterenkonia sp. K-15-9-6]|uniref:sigma-70 family RNA polymerase sigma factor n=1 Tax=Nesterenkonia sp. K-15-9-6 TaxID=3093918 RepID=UPI0040451646
MTIRECPGHGTDTEVREVSSEQQTSRGGRPQRRSAGERRTDAHEDLDDAWGSALEEPDDRQAAGVTDEELDQAVRSAAPVVWETLGKPTLEDVEDVLQETWESVWAEAERFDPERGSLATWVRTIAHRRAVDFVRVKVRQQAGQERLERAAMAREQSAVTIWADDDGYDAVLAAEEAVSQAGPLLRAAQRVIPNRETFQRAVEIIIGCDNDVGLASERLGISEDALRAARREFVMTCQVIAAAKAARLESKPVTVGVLLECVAESDPTEAGSWRREVAEAVAASGRPLGEITGDEVAELTEFSANTARQYWAKVKFWLQVAYTVMTAKHDLGEEPPVDEDEYFPEPEPARA